MSCLKQYNETAGVCLRLGVFISCPKLNPSPLLHEKVVNSPEKKQQWGLTPEVYPSAFDLYLMMSAVGKRACTEVGLWEHKSQILVISRSTNSPQPLFRTSDRMVTKIIIIIIIINVLHKNKIVYKFNIFEFKKYQNNGKKEFPVLVSKKKAEVSKQRHF